MSILKTNAIQSLSGKTILNNTGGILQVASTTLTSTFTTTAVMSTSVLGAAVTGLSVTLTPTSTSSKILVFCTVYAHGQNGVTQVYGYIARGSTRIGVPADAGSRPGIHTRGYTTGTDWGFSLVAHVLDTPSTTSPVTYNFYAGTEGSGTIYINRTSADTDASYGARGSSTITAVEISG